MEGEVVRRKCALRLRDHCPFRRLRRKHYDVSTASSSRSHAHSAQQPVSPQQVAEPRPPVRRVPAIDQTEPPADIHMAQDTPKDQDQCQDQEQDPEQGLRVWAEDRMDVDGTIDPETGEFRTGAP